MTPGPNAQRFVHVSMSTRFASSHDSGGVTMASPQIEQTPAMQIRLDPHCASVTQD